MTVNVLVADDEALIRQSLRSVLSQEGFTVTSATSGAEAWRLFQAERPDVVLLDLVLGDVDGLEVLRRIKQEGPETKVLILSAHGTIERAVTAMKLGAYEFLRKPFELEEILAAVRNAAHTSRLEGRLEYLTDRKRVRDASLIYESEAMHELLREVQVIAENPVPIVLVLGESGVGKQHIARRVHELSPRKSGPFIELNCSAIPESLIESELFGHERGAFSDARERKLGLVELADGGTLFLDEVGDLSAAAQAKLLTFLEQRTFRRVGATAVRRVDTRVVAATNRDLTKMVTDKSFRADLWYRLNGITLTVPPLRARVADVAPLAAHFLSLVSRELGRHFQRVDPAASQLLCGYDWPGNVRELRSVISRAALLHDGEVLLPAHLPRELFGHAPKAEPRVEPLAPPLEDKILTLAEVELAYIRQVLEYCKGNRTLAAQQLGITRQTLAKKVDAADPE
jgi:two-component system response regulator AtoC